ncbi:MAG: hypothetical protein JJE52_15995 [Acidimicrobiia bacterium]|nr:hypothetical protein [Acidimicrobiia bacterium]
MALWLRHPRDGTLSHDDGVNMRPTMRQRTAVPLAIGAAAMLAAVTGPGWLPGVVALVGAFIAGLLNPDEPVRAGLLTVALPVVGAVIRVLIDEPSAVVGVLMVSVLAAVLALIASHFGAGVARRRVPAGTP